MNKLLLYIGIAGALGMAGCDVILLGQPVSGTHYDLSSFGAVQQAPEWRAMAGAMGGLFCAFFIPFGFWHFKKMLGKQQPRLAGGLLIAFSSTIFFAGAFHAGYYFLCPALNPGGNAAHFVKTTAYLEKLSWLGVPGFGAGTIIYVRLAAQKPFAGWLKWANPVVTCGVFLLAFSILPAPVGGYLKPSFINLGWAAWFILAGRAA